MNSTLITTTVDVTRFHLEFFFVSHILLIGHVIRKLFCYQSRFYGYSSLEFQGSMEIVSRWSPRQIIHMDMFLLWVCIKERHL